MAARRESQTVYLSRMCGEVRSSAIRQSQPWGSPRFAEASLLGIELFPRICLPSSYAIRTRRGGYLSKHAGAEDAAIAEPNKMRSTRGRRPRARNVARIAPTGSGEIAPTARLVLPIAKLRSLEMRCEPALIAAIDTTVR